MVSWQVTATTVLCEATGREVTIMVYRDERLRCTGQNKTVKDKKAGLECSAETCPQIKAYQSRLMAEEAK
jgi:hypothetical protein